MGTGWITVVMVSLFALLIVGILLLGRFYPGSGAEQLDWRPTRSPEQEAENELDDLAGMMDAINAKRRARGERERTIEEVELRVMQDNAEIVRRAAERDPDKEQDIEELLALTNAKRAKRGEAPLSRAELERGL